MFSGLPFPPNSPWNMGTLLALSETWQSSINLVFLGCVHMCAERQGRGRTLPGLYNHAGEHSRPEATETASVGQDPMETESTKVLVCISLQLFS